MDDDTPASRPTFVGAGPDIAVAEADAVALLAAAHGGPNVVAPVVAGVAAAPVSHRILVSFLLAERALMLRQAPGEAATETSGGETGGGVAVDPVGLPGAGSGAVAIELLRLGRASELRTFLRTHTSTSELAAALWSTMCADALRAATVDVDQALTAWGLAVALDPDTRGARPPMREDPHPGQHA